MRGIARNLQRMCNERCKKCEGECAKRVQEMIKECAEKTEYVTIPMRPEDMRHGNCCKLGAPHHLLASLDTGITIVNSSYMIYFNRDNNT